MSAIRQEIFEYIGLLPDKELEVLKPMLSRWARFASEQLEIETDLTEEEQEIIVKGREEYQKNPESYASWKR
jgi:hypothetical protein